MAGFFFLGAEHFRSIKYLPAIRYIFCFAKGCHSYQG